MSRPLGKTVSIRLSDGVAGVSGVMHCGRIACPNCGPRIGADRRQDINRAVENWRAGGGVVLMSTHTLRHHKGQRFEELTKAMSGCWAAATGGKMWLKDRQTFGIRHTLRVWEEKWSIASGWHCHVHALLFLDAPSDETPKISVLLSSMFRRWSRAAVAQGLAVPLISGQELHLVTGDDAGDQLGGYFAKQAEQTSSKTAESMAWELSNPNGKASGDSFTPAEILEYAVGGDETMAGVWAEYEQGMIGRRTIAWSKGLRDAVGLDVEKTEQEAADQETSTKEDTVISMTARSWLRLTSARGKRYELLRLVSQESPAAGLDWLLSLGCVAVPGLHDFSDDEGASS